MLDVRLAGRVSDGDIDQVLKTIVYYLEIWPSVVSPITEVSRLLDGHTTSVDDRHIERVHCAKVPESDVPALQCNAHQWMIGVLCTYRHPECAAGTV
jgi:hypothetical protein